MTHIRATFDGTTLSESKQVLLASVGAQQVSHTTQNTVHIELEQVSIL